MFLLALAMPLLLIGVLVAKTWGNDTGGPPERTPDANTLFRSATQITTANIALKAKTTAAALLDPNAS